MLQTETRPEERHRSRRQIAEQRNTVREIFSQYASLCERLNFALPQDILEIAVVSGYDGLSESESRVREGLQSPNYQLGVHHLLERLGQGHPRHIEMLTLQTRLHENMTACGRYGDTELRRAERAQIIEALNELSLQTVNISFNELCGP